jgi:UDP-N-acetyl-D-galactosamine dehydrogenase
VDRTLKIVAGQTPEVAARIVALYGKVTTVGVFVARDIRTAEAAKVIENAQRDINIAFINEVTMIFGRLGLSVYDVLDSARTKWNFLDFRPGLVGGHCIGVDPFYLAACAKAAGHAPEIVLAGRTYKRLNGPLFCRVHRRGLHQRDTVATPYARPRHDVQGECPGPAQFEGHRSRACA